MESTGWGQYEPGRRFFGTLPHGKDILETIAAFCKSFSIQTASFSLTGNISFATLAVYDQKQKVYATFSENTRYEIISCTGNVSLWNKKPFVTAYAILGNHGGNLIGGRLFSKSIVFAAEIDFQELIGEPLERIYDEETGLILWNRSTSQSAWNRSVIE